MKILTVFVNFYLHQTQNCFGQIKKMKGEIFRFQLKKKITPAKCLRAMLDIKMCPIPLFD